MTEKVRLVQLTIIKTPVTPATRTLFATVG